MQVHGCSTCGCVQDLRAIVYPGCGISNAGVGALAAVKSTATLRVQMSTKSTCSFCFTYR